MGDLNPKTFPFFWKCLGRPGQATEEIPPWMAVILMRSELTKREAAVLSTTKNALSLSHLRDLSWIKSLGFGIPGSVGGQGGVRHQDRNVNAWTCAHGGCGGILAKERPAGHRPLPFGPKKRRALVPCGFEPSVWWGRRGWKDVGTGG